MRDCSNYRDYKGDNLETIPGIGIYTTNLVENNKPSFDPSFDIFLTW